MHQDFRRLLRPDGCHALAKLPSPDVGVDGEVEVREALTVVSAGSTERCGS